MTDAWDNVIPIRHADKVQPRCAHCDPHPWHGGPCACRDWRKRGECGCPTSVETTGGDAA